MADHIDTEVWRRDWASLPMPAVRVVAVLCDEIDRLRARLAEVEAELRHAREFGVIASRTAGQEADRADAAEAEAREYRSAITWHTTCLSCSKVLDSAYEQTARAEAAEAKLAPALAGLGYIASQACETNTTGRCDDTRVPGAQYTADRMCNPCVARAALRGERDRGQ